MLYLVGLGPGDANRLPTQAFSLLTGSLPVYNRTARHPVYNRTARHPVYNRTARHPVWEAEPLRSVLPNIVSLDSEYETGTTFEATYTAIVDRVLVAARIGETVYAVPGHPLVGEATVARLIPRLRAEGIPFQVVGAASFVDACLEAIGEAVTGDLHIVDALSLNPNDATPPEVLRTGGPLLLYQVHSRAAASQAKLALMRAGYPDEFPVTVIQAAGVPHQEQVTTLPLFELDHRDHDHLTSVFVAPLLPEQRLPGFSGLVRVMARLRDPERGCPWDKEQTHASLRHYVLEEAYEVTEAIDNGDPDKLCEELGDLLLQVVFHAQLAAEEGTFDSEAVCKAIVDKMIRRHPHVFGEVTVNDAADVLKNWQTIKAAEKGYEARKSILDGIPTSYPALMTAHEISKRAVKVGFEWPDIESILAKVDEELAELRAEIMGNGPKDRIESELGDVLFTLVNVGRRTGVEPETALRRQLNRFRTRFHYIEQQAANANRPLEFLSLAEMEVYWQEAKLREKNGL